MSVRMVRPETGHSMAPDSYRAATAILSAAPTGKAGTMAPLLRWGARGFERYNLPKVVTPMTYSQGWNPTLTAPLPCTLRGLPKGWDHVWFAILSPAPSAEWTLSKHLLYE